MAVAQVNREELAWAAGFFDGEGCVYLQRNNRHAGRYAIVTIGQAGRAGEKEPAVLLRFKTAMAPVKMSLYGPFTKGSPKWKPSWDLMATDFESVQAIMCRLWPFLGTIKRQQFLDVMRQVVYLDRTRCKRGHVLADAGGRDGQGRCRECRRETKQ